MRKILKYVIYDLLRSRLIITYTILLAGITFGVIYLGKDSDKAVTSLLNVTLLLVPLVNIVFGTIHFYNSRQFIETLLTLPLKRTQLFWAEFLGLAVSMSLCYLIGTGIPLIIYGATAKVFYLLLSGVLLSFIFTSLSFLSSVINKDKARGIGVSLMLWFYFAVLFDAIALMIYMLFSNYPLQKVVLIFSALNPIDLARIMVLLRLDISALLGYSGATFQQFFGTPLGTVFSITLLVLWCIIPSLISLRIFIKKDF